MIIFGIFRRGLDNYQVPQPSPVWHVQPPHGRHTSRLSSELPQTRFTLSYVPVYFLLYRLLLRLLPTTLRYQFVLTFLQRFQLRLLRGQLVSCNV